MKHQYASLLFAVTLMGGPLPTLLAADDPAVFKAEEAKLEETAAPIETEAQTNEGQQAVTQKLKNQFQVDDRQISNLRNQNIGYGEIGIVLSLAKQLPGGITDQNIQTVMGTRQREHKRGWGQVARELNLNLGRSISDVKKAKRQSAETVSPPDAEGAAGTTGPSPTNTARTAGPGKSSMTGKVPKSVAPRSSPPPKR
ncbi:MAG: hypothetical protein Q8Q08_04795 [Candidatus Omnitrophota bacterium]|nr:hypothetical protein [Candidatus Omnitrophota bacterium]MDZ4242219.1 hypothetical protein [Candidatus Omnitrophota bacterium]